MENINPNAGVLFVWGLVCPKMVWFLGRLAVSGADSR